MVEPVQVVCSNKSDFWRILMFEMKEHPFLWLARKRHKSHFRDRTSRSSYQPSSNTPLLYDGSVEAQAIVKGAMSSLNLDSPEAWSAWYTLEHVLDYLKGRDIFGLFSRTGHFF